MSDQQWGPNPPPPPQPPSWGQQQPPHPDLPQPPAPKQKRQFLVTKIAIGVAAGIALFLIGMIVLVAVLLSSGKTSDKQATGTPATIASQPAEEPATTEQTPAYTPTPKDFTLTIKTLKKECFGSAGCNVTFRIQVGYDGPALDPSTTYEVTYEVRGAEDGPQINTLTVQGDQSSVDEEEFVSTKSAAVKLKAVVTDVAEQ